MEKLKRFSLRIPNKLEVEIEYLLKTLRTSQKISKNIWILDAIESKIKNVNLIDKKGKDG